MNDSQLIYSLIGCITGWIVGALAWHISEYRRRKKYRKERMWDILNGK